MPRIGDPHPMGWVTVATYATAGVLAGLVVAQRRTRAAAFWMVLAALLTFLAVNKQLDLQSALTAAGRCLSQAQGWYENRRTVQAAFIGTLALCGLVALLLMLRALQGRLAENGLAAAGAAFLVTFVLVRAVGFHHVDAMLRLPVAGLRMNWILELGGIALIAANAAVLLRRRTA
jgi:hypothetical protein